MPSIGLNSRGLLYPPAAIGSGGRWRWTGFRELRRRHLRRLEAGDGTDLTDPQVMQGAWR
ncbi:MAG: hypothetical protein OXH20_04785 [bacterium]|nr:hypothetical protein [bacterium]